MRIGLERPYWAVLTSFITAQPLAGAVKSKGVFRAIGTMSGVTAVVILVPNFVNAPELLTFFLGLWLAVCTYLSLLERSPRSYVFALAGYTAAIIGFPAVSSPGTIFTIAALRAQEILLGVVCTAVVHTLVFPTTALSHTRRRARSIMADTRKWLGEALNLSSGKETERRKLAVDLHDLHQLAVHLSFETGAGSHSAETTRALQHQLSKLLAFMGGAEDRLLQLGDRTPIAIVEIKNEVGKAITADPDAVIEWDVLLSRVRALTPPMQSPLIWRDALLANFLGCLTTMIESYRTSQTLVERMQDSRTADRPRAIDRIRIKPHRDHDIALRGALSTFFAVVATCALWIATAWPDGATAATYAGIWTVLFSNLDNAKPALHQIFLGTIAGAALAALYVGAILPRVTDFVTLFAVLAPTFLVIGSLMPRPRTTTFATGVFNSFPILLGLNNGFVTTVPQVVNAGIAQAAGAAISLVFIGLFRAPNLDRSARVLVRLGRRELAQRAVQKRAPPLYSWTYRMLDRIAILEPRLTFLGIDPAESVTTILRDIRTGINVSELREVHTRVSASDQRILDTLLRRIASFLDGQGRSSADQLGRAVDLCLHRAVRFDGGDLRLRAVVALVGIRRNLLPDLADFEEGRQDPVETNPTDHDKLRT